MTIIEKLIDHINQAATYNRYDFSKPSVILWPDGEKLWEKVIPMLVDAMQNLFVLDEVTNDSRRGPSPKIRYLISRVAAGTIPIVYLPGISRLAFRGFAGFPKNERHLYALQFQGQFWIQKNGRDWTPLAFLSSEEGGLGLDIARDNATLKAIAEQLETILRAKISELQGKKIEASDIHGLVARDPAGLLLQWLSEPERKWDAWKAAERNAFSALCKKDFGFVPEKDGVLVAAEKLLHADGNWKNVWERYVEAPRTFGGIRKLLDNIRPTDIFDEESYRYPKNNSEKEDELRSNLLGIGSKSRDSIAGALTALCLEHINRAHTVWAELGEAPLAKACEYLHEMLECLKIGMAGTDWNSLCVSYVKFGWKIDRAAWKALSIVKTSKDIEALRIALNAIYKPWLEELAERTYSISQSYPNISPSHCKSLNAETGTVMLFVDGLRCDLGLELNARLKREELITDISTEWAALPTVTATSKPAWQPLASLLAGTDISAKFEPMLASTSQPLNTHGFRKLLSETGWTLFDSQTAGDPEGSGWTEIGSIDHSGHTLGAKLVWHIEVELDLVIQRVNELLTNGWKKVIITTDHGWLLLSGGLPKVELPKHLSVTRWGRTAIPQPGAVHSFKEVSWFWGNGFSVVCAPGICAFTEGLEYAHGGITLQETLVPMIAVTSQAVTSGKSIRFTSYRWTGLRLQVSIENAPQGCHIDIRTITADSATSVLTESQKKKEIAEDGNISIIVEDDSYLGQSVVMVAIVAGKVAAKQPITIGEN